MIDNAVSGINVYDKLTTAIFNINLTINKIII